jgi:uncharacterized LabA/DUF88 family protein
MRVTVYVDGFNLYYRALQKTPYRWLDLAALSKALLKPPKHVVTQIRYFTALVNERVDKPQQTTRQLTYLRALKTIPHLSIHYGQFYASVKMAKLVTPLRDGTKYVPVHDSEEKGTDVNIASYLLLDGFRDRYDMAAVLSNDSDLAHTIEIVRQELGKPVVVLCPCTERRSIRLRDVASYVRQIWPKQYASCQFDPGLSDANGRITKPSTW